MNSGSVLIYAPDKRECRSLSRHSISNSPLSPFSANRFANSRNRFDSRARRADPHILPSRAEPSKRGRRGMALTESGEDFLIERG